MAEVVLNSFVSEAVNKQFEVLVEGRLVQFPGSTRPVDMTKLTVKQATTLAALHPRFFKKKKKTPNNRHKQDN